MSQAILSELLNFLQNSPDGKAIATQSNLPEEDVHKVAKEILPQITEQAKSSPQSLAGLFQIFTQNQSDPNSMLSHQPGFDVEKASAEGNNILSSLFGSGGKAQLADDVSEKTGVNSFDIQSLMPLLAALATKFFGNKANAIAQGDNLDDHSESSDTKSDNMSQALGLLDQFGNKDGKLDAQDLTKIGTQIMNNLF